MNSIKYTKPVLKEIELYVDIVRGESEPPPPASRRDYPIWEKGKRQSGELPWENWDDWEEDDIDS
ncbi:hypothetical protein ACFLQV_00940 [Calditrichota bacterium]